ncbi:MAG: leucyl aminopeptidase [Polyangiaceae bacterium]|nr:leucyl aminopeptidase [Polyangiaceae bacterium]
MSPKIQLLKKNVADFKADVLVVMIRGAEASEDETIALLDEHLGGELSAHLERVRFQPSAGSSTTIPLLGRLNYSELLVVGSAEVGELDDAKLVAAAAKGVRDSLAKKPKKLAIVASNDDSIYHLALGVGLGAYQFDRYVFEKESQAAPAVSVLRTRSASASDKAAIQQGLGVAKGVCLARDLINEPPNILTPESFAKRAKDVAKRGKLTCKLLDQQGIIRAGMNLHAAVGQGSTNAPWFIHLTYKPKGKSKGKVAFVGKGLTFDSGGLCIKPMAGMADMKTDMSGGAAVLGLMEALTAKNPDVEVHGIIGAAENMPDANAYRPSDVFRSLSGKGVEIINTDAEGRLVLADALTYATRLKPDFIVDAATLTGATLVSLGNPYSAFFTGSEEMAAAMTEAAATVGESFWRMPLIEELRAQLKSSITDIKHTGTRWGGAITAALFLREFTAGLPWMHCDIPGPVYRDSASGMHPKGGTGHAVLTFLELVEKHAASPIVPPQKPTPRRTKAKATPKRAKSPRARSTRK